LAIKPRKKLLVNNNKMKYSLTVSGVIVSIAGTLLVKYGFTENCSNEIITTAPVIIGGIMSWVGRVRQGDVNLFGVKK